MPIPTIAFILTTANGLIHQQEGHMENIRRFRASGHSNLSDLRGEWFRYALVYSGASIRDDDCDLENLIDMDEFGPAPGPSRLTSNPSQSTSRQSQQPSRKRQRNPSTDRSSEAGPSTQRLRHDEPSDDENVAINMQMVYYEADAEEYSNGEPMDVDTQPEREGSYEFPNPTPQPPTPSDANQEPHFTAEQKGKGRVD
ncbi:hypothetical protein FRC07_013540 [Ceratobasidium sp. 392]|nr:hypothetical protein FRC07_013540 [Ceratobasidium sp. 392]